MLETSSLDTVDNLKPRLRATDSPSITNKERSDDSKNVLSSRGPNVYWLIAMVHLSAKHHLGKGWLPACWVGPENPSI